MAQTSASRKAANLPATSCPMLPGATLRPTSPSSIDIEELGLAAPPPPRLAWRPVAARAVFACTAFGSAAVRRGQHAAYAGSAAQPERAPKSPGPLHLLLAIGVEHFVYVSACFSDDLSGGDRAAIRGWGPV